jgi:hypothetical protein
LAVDLHAMIARLAAAGDAHDAHLAVMRHVHAALLAVPELNDRSDSRI